jgi:tRNA wybutosine-synthesizing protein 3
MTKNEKIDAGTKSRFEMTKNHHTNTYLTAKKNGKVDLDFIPLCDYILDTEEFFTSSCCAGRIALVGLDKEESKKESAFHRKWHRVVKFDEVYQGVNNFNGTILWFKQEPLIFHIGTNNIKNAKKILEICEKCGIKRAGIKVAKEGKFIIELLGTHNINLPIRENQKTLISDEYFKTLVKKANEKFKKNQKTLKKLEKEIKKQIKKKK